MKFKLSIIYVCLLLGYVNSSSSSYILWVKNLKHHYEEKAKTQIEWANELSQDGIINGSFFKSNGMLIPPFVSETSSLFKMNRKNWWYIDYEIKSDLLFPWKTPIETYVLKQSFDEINIDSKFIISVCPPLIYDTYDIENSIIIHMGGRTFTYRNCRRTLIGKTEEGSMFIVVGNGNLFVLRKNIRDKINNIEWLANLDGGSSSFLTLNKTALIKNKTRVPSVVSFDTYLVEVF